MKLDAGIKRKTQIKNRVLRASKALVKFWKSLFTEEGKEKSWAKEQIAEMARLGGKLIL